MKLTKLVMKNWCSFYGSHELDFTGKGDADSYLIFGQIGKGKTSTVSAIEWALFGRVMDSIDDGEDHILRRLRPIIDAEFFNGKELKFALPLLVDRAYREGDYCTEVEMHFIHDGDECKLMRKALPLNGKTPLSDGDMQIHLSLSVGQEKFETECKAKETNLDMTVQPKINQIIPSEISRFFFVKGDAIREFTGLIFGSERNPKLKQEVNSVVGLPALTQSSKDFSRLKSQAEDTANSLARRARAGDKLDEQISGLMLQLEEIRDGFLDPVTGERTLGIDELRTQYESLDGQVTDLEEQMKVHEDIRNLLSKKETWESELKKLKKHLPDYYKGHKDNLQEGWKIIIQKVINRSLEKLEGNAITEKKLLGAIEKNKKDLQHDKERLASKDGSIPCSVCKEIRPVLSKSGREKLLISVNERKQNISDSEYALATVKGSTDKKLEILEFKTDIDGKSIFQSEALVKNQREHEVELKEWILGCEQALLNEDVGNLNKIQNRLEKTREDRTFANANLEFAKDYERDILETLKTTRAELKRKGGSSTQSEQAELKVNVYAWFQDIWEKSLEEYRESVRHSIDKICTERFLEWVDEPDKYSRVETSENWSLNVYGVDDHWAPLGNPGHRQLLSLCFIESLRQNSNIEFPMVFDNPGAAVDQETMGRILDYYLNNPPGQFIALSHSGGMREKEMMDNYYNAGKITRAWRVEYVKGQNRHSQFKLL